MFLLKLIHIYGEGVLEKKLREYAISLGVSDKVNFCGYSHQLREKLKMYDMFLLTSRAESFGNVLVEAMSCSIPVISTDCPVGPREILEYGKYGKLVRVDNLSELIDAIIETINNYNLDMIKIAFNRSKEFSITASVEQYENMFGEIFENG